MSKESAEKIADKVGLGAFKDKTADVLMRLYKLFIEKDALLIEVNPYAEDANGNCKNIFLLSVRVIKNASLKNLIIFCSFLSGCQDEI